ncbi:pyrroline-5-carboxylate reductase [Vicingus serpentipes]|uniref:pyrroline-5-carboxylate reductase n=1 Tax=Vicingus serpentipes TaxID=1926625 RepID=UPI001CB8E750|nr:pyrroline-5-carboxylate reductase [Vicingus serpentipes]
MNTKITIIGAGNLGTSLVKGLVESKIYTPQNFVLTRRNTTKLSSFKEIGCEIAINNIEAVTNANIIILAVLPQKINEVLNELKGSIKEDQLVVSLVSGVKVKNIQNILGSTIPVVRAMPNTAIAIRESMTCIATTSNWNEKLPEVEDLFKLVGETIVINEEQMTSATALCACGIAFFLRAIRAASQGGNEIDFHANEALKMAAQTAKGAASLLIANNSHPEDEIDKVTSPKGCTIAGLNEMEHNGFSSSFIKGITISAKQAKDLYTEE